MADLINRDHAAQAIEAYLCIQCDHDTDHDPECIACPYFDGSKILKSVPSVNHWIPCSERMPENIKPVYITWRNPFSDITGTGFAHYFAGNWYWYSQFSEDILGEYGEYDDIVEVDVIAWMPTPEAYKPPEGGTDNA